MKINSQLLLFICLNILIGQVDYQTQIQTIFNNNCTSCHINGGAYYGGLDLSTYANVMTGGNSGAVITPFDHANSYLWQRVNNGEMPPGNNPDLTAAQVSLVALWIDEGALEFPAITTPALVINEFMASNDTTIADTSGEFADWVEIYNPSDEAVDLAGMTFSDGDDASAIPTGFPDITTIPAGGFIFVWFDKDPDEGPLHINAKLSDGGESVILFDTDGTTVIDSIDFGEQFTDVSTGRFPDSSDTWDLTVTPTPGAANVYTAAVFGCNDPDAINYNPDANVNDDSCEYPTILCVLGEVYVSEAATSGDPEDYIEIFNAGDVECSLAGFQLDDSEDLDDLIFGNVILEPGAYWVGYEDATDSFSSGLSSSGDIIVLADTSGNMLTVILEASVEVDGVQLSQSFDATGTGCYTMPTPGAVNDTCVTLNISNAGTIPTQFTLHQNYPNPFNPVTTLRYDLPVNGFVNITVYDMLGRKVKTLINQTQDTGYRSVIWNATNDYGRPVSAGIYLYQIQAGKYISTKKMVLLK